MAEVKVPIERVDVGLQTLCSSHAAEHALPPIPLAENGRYVSPLATRVKVTMYASHSTLTPVFMYSILSYSLTALT